MLDLGAESRSEDAGGSVSDDESSRDPEVSRDKLATLQTSQIGRCDVLHAFESS